MQKIPTPISRHIRLNYPDSYVSAYSTLADKDVNTHFVDVRSNELIYRLGFTPDGKMVSRIVEPAFGKPLSLSLR